MKSLSELRLRRSPQDMESTSNPCPEVLLLSKYLSEEIPHCNPPVDMHSCYRAVPEGDVTLLIELTAYRHSQIQQKRTRVTVMLTDLASFLQDKTRALLKDILETKSEMQQTRAAHRKQSRHDSQGDKIFVFYSIFFGT